MSACSEATRIIEELEVLATERQGWNRHGPHFRIVHRHHKQTPPCGPDEEVSGVFLVHCGREFRVPLATVLLLLVDYLARHTRLAQSARQIERGTREDSFYTRPGARKGTGVLSRGIPRAYVRVYIGLILKALGKAFREARLPIDPGEVLAAEKTVMNEVAYQLKATVEWQHTTF